MGCGLFQSGLLPSPPSRADLTVSIIHLPIPTTHDCCGQDTALTVYVLREQTAAHMSSRDHQCSLQCEAVLLGEGSPRSPEQYLMLT